MAACGPGEPTPSAPLRNFDGTGAGTLLVIDDDGEPKGIIDPCRT